MKPEARPSSPAEPEAGGTPSAGLRLPTVPQLDLDSPLGGRLRTRWQQWGHPDAGLGRLGALAVRIGLIQNRLDAAWEQPQCLVFAANHGISDEGLAPIGSANTLESVQRLLTQQTAASALAPARGWGYGVVDAGLAAPVPSPGGGVPGVRLIARKIGFGSRNMMRGPAMSGDQTLAAVSAGMDLVRHLPGNLVALGQVSHGADLCASLMLARLCNVPLEDTLPHDIGSETHREHIVRLMFELLRKHRPAQKPLAWLSAVGGFDLAMMVGALIQAASERRMVLLDGYLAGAAALVARELRPAVMDYTVCSQRTSHHGHRLMLIHLQAEPLIDLQLQTEDGTASLLAWPLLQAAAELMAKPPGHPRAEALPGA